MIHASLLREVIHDAALLAALDNMLRFVVIRHCVYVTFDIKHRVALSLITTDPRMRLVQLLLQRCMITGRLATLQRCNIHP